MFQNLLESGVLYSHSQRSGPCKGPGLEREKKAEPQNHGASDLEYQGA